MFHQTFAPHDLLVIAILIGLEGVLSIDNALVLGLLASRLAKSLQTRALTYGLIGAITFRIVAVALAAALLRWRWAKLIGGIYLTYVAVKHLLWPEKKDKADSESSRISEGGICKSILVHVLMIELTDIALCSRFNPGERSALVGAAPTGEKIHPKLWVVILGGVAGVIMMRFAAVLFIRLLERFPRFETSAYLLVLIIGAKMYIDIITIYKHGSIEFGIDQAERYHKGLIATFDLLADHPRMARERSEFRPPVRLHAYRAHVIVYIMEPSGILIVRVLHGRQIGNGT